MCHKKKYYLKFLFYLPIIYSLLSCQENKEYAYYEAKNKKGFFIYKIENVFYSPRPSINKSIEKYASDDSILLLNDIYYKKTLTGSKRLYDSIHIANSTESYILHSKIFSFDLKIIDKIWNVHLYRSKPTIAGTYQFEISAYEKDYLMKILALLDSGINKKSPMDSIFDPEIDNALYTNIYFNDQHEELFNWVLMSEDYQFLYGFLRVILDKYLGDTSDNRFKISDKMESFYIRERFNTLSEERGIGFFIDPSGYPPPPPPPEKHILDSINAKYENDPF